MKQSIRNLPPLCVMNDASPVHTPDDWRARRRELIEILSREEYGFTPAAPASVRAEVISSERAFAGKAVQSLVKLAFDTPNGEFSFPVNLIIPEGKTTSFTSSILGSSTTFSVIDSSFSFSIFSGFISSTCTILLYL